MSLVVLKCPNCGGQLEFENSREFGFCQFCGYKVMIKQEINNTNNIFNNTTIINNDFSAQNKKMLEAADKALQEGNYKSAKEIANAVLEKDVTAADAYRIILVSNAKQRVSEQGYITVAYKDELYPFYDKYHLYSSDQRGLREVLQDYGVSYDFEGLVDKFVEEEMVKFDANKANLVKRFNSAVMSIGWREEATPAEVNALVQMLDELVRYAYQYFFIIRDDLQEHILHIDDFAITIDGRRTTFEEEYKKLLNIKKVAGYYKSVIPNFILNEDTLEKFKQSYADYINKLYPMTGMKKFVNKSSNEFYMSEYAAAVPVLEELVRSKDRFRDDCRKRYESIVLPL